MAMLPFIRKTGDESYVIPKFNNQGFEYIPRHNWTACLLQIYTLLTTSSVSHYLIDDWISTVRRILGPPGLPWERYPNRQSFLRFFNQHKGALSQTTDPDSQDDLFVTRLAARTVDDFGLPALASLCRSSSELEALLSTMIKNGMFSDKPSFAFDSIANPGLRKGLKAEMMTHAISADLTKRISDFTSHDDIASGRRHPYGQDAFRTSFVSFPVRRTEMLSRDSSQVAKWAFCHPTEVPHLRESYVAGKSLLSMDIISDLGSFVSPSSGIGARVKAAAFPGSFISRTSFFDGDSWHIDPTLDVISRHLWDADYRDALGIWIRETDDGISNIFLDESDPLRRLYPVIPNLPPLTDVPRFFGTTTASTQLFSAAFEHIISSFARDLCKVESDYVVIKPKVLIHRGETNPNLTSLYVSSLTATVDRFVIEGSKGVAKTVNGMESIIFTENQTFLSDPNRSANPRDFYGGESFSVVAVDSAIPWDSSGGEGIGSNFGYPMNYKVIRTLYARKATVDTEVTISDANLVPVIDKRSFYVNRDHAVFLRFKGLFCPFVRGFVGIDPSVKVFADTHDNVLVFIPRGKLELVLDKYVPGFGSGLNVSGTTNHVHYLSAALELDGTFQDTKAAIENLYRDRWMNVIKTFEAFAYLRRLMNSTDPNYAENLSDTTTTNDIGQFTTFRHRLGYSFTKSSLDGGSREDVFWAKLVMSTDRQEFLNQNYSIWFENESRPNNNDMFVIGDIRESAYDVVAGLVTSGESFTSVVEGIRSTVIGIFNTDLYDDLPGPLSWLQSIVEPWNDRIAVRSANTAKRVTNSLILTHPESASNMRYLGSQIRAERYAELIAYYGRTPVSIRLGTDIAPDIISHPDFSRLRLRWSRLGIFILRPGDYDIFNTRSEYRYQRPFTPA
jgi:hypothetical protein